MVESRFKPQSVSFQSSHSESFSIPPPFTTPRKDRRTMNKCTKEPYSSYQFFVLNELFYLDSISKGGGGKCYDVWKYICFGRLRRFYFCGVLGPGGKRPLLKMKAVAPGLPLETTCMGAHALHPKNSHTSRHLRDGPF